VIAKLRAHEHRALQVISEQRINNEKMALQRDSAIATVTVETNRNKRITQVVEEACRIVPELAIPEEELVEVHVRKLATGVHDAHTEMARIQLELNL